jgi:SAM domain (Sterile alpha motif)
VDGSATEVGNWLRTEKFDASIINKFVKWNATAMLTISEAELKIDVLGMEGRRLWALLKTVRTLQCRSRPLNLLVIVICKYRDSLILYAAFHCSNNLSMNHSLAQAIHLLQHLLRVESHASMSRYSNYDI